MCQYVLLNFISLKSSHDLLAVREGIQCLRHIVGPFVLRLLLFSAVSARLALLFLWLLSQLVLLISDGVPSCFLFQPPPTQEFLGLISVPTLKQELG